MALILATFPFALFVFLLLFKRTPLLKVSLITLLTVSALAIFYWQIEGVFLVISGVKGFWVALDIFVIIVGAIFFLEVLRRLGLIEEISAGIRSFSTDYRVQVILLAWFLENFIEGTAGFGTPAVIVAPLLVAIGLTPLSAVVISLLGNSTSVVFGAAGTPIRTGFAGLATTSIPLNAALLNLVGFIVPVFMLLFLVWNQKERKEQFLEALPFAIWSGLVFVIPSVFLVFLGQEFPSILGSVIGLILAVLGLRLRIFLPRQIRTLKETEEEKQKTPILRAATPYLILIGLLIAGKFLLSESVSLPLWGRVSYTISFYNPGLTFMAAGLVAVALNGKRSFLGKTIGLAIKRATGPFLVIIAMATITQLMIYSGQLQIIARLFETPGLPLLSPFVGAFGAFITGSATVSNLMFGNFINAASVAIGLNAEKILALELVGAAAGNMIALTDVLAAETIVGLKNEERRVLAGVILPCTIYVFIVGIIGMIII